MRIPVLVQPILETGYRASCGSFPDLTADGTTAERAVDRLRDRIRELMAAGAWITEVDVPVEVRSKGDDPTENLGESDDEGIPLADPDD
jgi:predicted RNase H-like HicB family nuclease